MPCRHSELLAAAGVPAARTFAAAEGQAAANDGGAVHLASLPAVHQLRAASYDVSPLQIEFGWSPQPLEEAIGDYIQWLRQEEAEGQRQRL